MATGVQVVFDCADPDRLARFWAEALGYRVQDPPQGFDSWDAYLRSAGVPEDKWNSASAIVDPDGAGPRIYFQRVPEGKTAKNRVHLDLNASGGRELSEDTRREQVDAEVRRLVGLGAARVGSVAEYGEYHVVLRDPEENEFCVQ